MPTRDWGSLGWAPTLNFGLQTERQLAQSNLADAGKGAEYKFNPTAMNQQLLTSLGYTGQGLADVAGSDYGFGAQPQWSDDARTWLNNNGYTVGVAHDPNTSAGGRPEYYGLVDKNGQWVAGQDDPTMTISDTMGDQVAMFATFLGPVLGGIAAAGEAGALGGAAGGAGEVSAAGSLGGAADGVTALGSSWSPQAMGLTNTIAPATNAAEIASLASGIPSVAPSITDLALQGAMRGAVSGGVKGLVNGQNPFESALQGAIGGGLTGGIGGGVGALNPDGAGWINSGIAGGIKSAITGGNPLIGAAGGAIGSLGSAAFQNEAPTAGSGMDLEGDFLSSMYGSGSSPEYDFLSSMFGSGDSSSGWGSSILNGLKGAIGGTANAVGGGSNLAALIGAGLGAASGGGSQTSSRDPWGPSQDFLKAILGDAGTALANLRQQPYTPQQQTQYSNAYAGLDQARSALPGLLSWGQGAMQRQSTTPSMAQLFGGGLLQQPTAQAGGGLVGEDDRMKALMARGRGLIG